MAETTCLFEKHQNNAKIDIGNDVMQRSNAHGNGKDSK